MSSRTQMLLAFGGRSSEHEVSLRSAACVLDAIDRDRFEPVLLGVRRDGSFRTGRADWSPKQVIDSGEPCDDLVGLARACAIVFPVMHGPYGEDGTFQGLLDFHALPYVGAGVLASALCMDKAAFKHHVSAAPYDIPVTPGVTVDFALEPGQDPIASAAARVESSGLGFPVFVKPARQGSSIGVFKVEGSGELAPALTRAAAYDSKLVVERGLDAREIELAVLGDGGPETMVSQPGEIVLPPGTWYDYDNKYQNDVAGLEIPAKLDAARGAELQSLALRAFRATGCSGLARIDFFVDRSTGKPYLNELNTMPGFTSISMYPKLMAHAGVGYRDLITRLATLGIEAHRRRASLKIDR